jgi:hypothetical protein
VSVLRSRCIGTERDRTPLLLLMFVILYFLVIYMFNSGPTRCTLYSLFLSSLALHVSGAIRTHHQEHNCRVQPYVLYGLVCYSIGAGTGLGHPYN